jgi:GWxTD domain-containing protein
VIRKIFFLFAFCSILLCQKFNHASGEKNILIRGIVTDASTSQPLEFASVYISGTTIGTTTKKDGRFILIADSDLKNNLAASSVGYKSQVIQLGNIDGDTLEVKFKLQPTVYNYSQVDVDAESASKWRDQFEIFKKQFLGTGPFADECEILNKYKIDFVEIENKLLAVCNEPLQIINNALGYKIDCILSNFEFNRDKKIFYYVVDARFTEMIPSTKDSVEEIQNNRLKAYHGSMRHLLNQLIDPKLFNKERDYDLSYDDSIGTYQGFWVKEPEHIVNYDNITGTYVINPRESGKKIYGMKSNAIRITYNGLFRGGQSRINVLNKNGIRFNRKGFLLSPKDYLLVGDMSLKRIADLLPDNWQPPQKDTVVNIIQLREALKQNDSAENNYQLAKALLNLKTNLDINETLNYSRRAVELDEKNISYKLLYAEALENFSFTKSANRDKKKEAEKEYRKIIAMDNNCAEAHSNLGRILQEDFSKYNNAFEANDSKVSPFADSSNILASRSESGMTDNRLSLPQLDRDIINPAAANTNGKISMFKSEPQRANRNMDSEPTLSLTAQGLAINGITGTGQTSYNKIKESKVRGLFNEAEKELLTAISLQPYEFESYASLAKLYIDDKQTTKIIPHLKNYVQAIRNNKEAYLLLGLAYYLLHENEKANNEFNLGISLHSREELNELEVQTSQQLLEPIMKDRFSTMSRKDVEQAISVYWLMDDPLLLTTYNESYMEHISRIVYANLFYSIDRQNITGWKTDRGEIVMRYGFPQEKANLLPEYEIWTYNDKAIGFNINKEDESRRLLNEDNNLTLSSISLLREKNILDLKQTTPRVYEPTFEGPTFNLPIKTYQFKSGEDGKTDTYIVYSVNTSDSLTKSELFADGFELGTFFINNGLVHEFEKKEMIPGIKNFGKTSSDQTLAASKMFSVQPKTGGLAFEMIRKNDKGVFTNHSRFEVKNFASDSLSLSNIVPCDNLITEGKKEFYIKRGDISLLPNPNAMFSGKTKFFIYYEVYNLPLNDRKTTDFTQSLTIRKKEKAGIGGIINDIGNALGISRNNEKISLTSDYQTQEKNPQMYLQLDMSKYEAGNYIITVTIKDKVTGKSISGDSEIVWE